MLDLVVWRTTGRISGALEKTLDANRALATMPPVLPPGVTVTIPDDALTQPAVRAPFQLWD